MLLLLQSTAPFFTNDVYGWLRLLMLVGAIVGPLLAVVYKLTFSKTNEAVEALERDVNGLGERVAKQETATTACDAKVGELKGMVAQQQATVGNLREAQGELKAGLEALRDMHTELHRDIMMAIQESAKATQLQVSNLAIQVARLDERAKVSTDLATPLAEIVDLMRNNMRRSS